eukprot:366501-Chlamydomonas_euryale.AAC.21
MTLPQCKPIDEPPDVTTPLIYANLLLRSSVALELHNMVNRQQQELMRLRQNSPKPEVSPDARSAIRTLVQQQQAQHKLPPATTMVHNHPTAALGHSSERRGFGTPLPQPVFYPLMAQEPSQPDHSGDGVIIVSRSNPVTGVMETPAVSGSVHTMGTPSPFASAMSHSSKREDSVEGLLEMRAVALALANDEKERLRRALLDAEVDLQVGAGNLLSTAGAVCPNGHANKGPEHGRAHQKVTAPSPPPPTPHVLLSAHANHSLSMFGRTTNLVLHHRNYWGGMFSGG